VKVSALVNRMKAGTIFHAEKETTNDQWPMYCPMVRSLILGQIWRSLRERP